MKILFWISFSILFYIYLGYPVFLIIASMLKKKPIKKSEITPSVSLIIPAYNEEAVIREKIENVLALDYPKENLEIIVASDGSTDHTAQLATEYLNQGIKLLDFESRRGKPTMLNEIVPKATGEIVVFSDSSSILNKDAIRKLVRNFADPQIGCVCGDYKFGFTDNSLRGKGEGLFVRYELFIKKKEAQIDSVLGLHGALYAIRRDLYQNLKPDTINDDYILPAKIVEKGYRSVFEEYAVVYEKHGLTLKSEFARRTRMSAGNCQMIGELKSLLNPARGMLFIEFLSHKILRTFTPIFLVMLFISNALIGSGNYKLLFILQLIFYLAAFLGYLMETRKFYFKLFHIPFYFCLSNIAVALGLFKFLRGAQSAKWKR